MAAFKKIDDVELLNNVDCGASVLVEQDGALKRVPGKRVFGGGASMTLNFEPDGSWNSDSSFEDLIEAASANPYSIVVALRENINGTVKTVCRCPVFGVDVSGDYDDAIRICYFDPSSDDFVCIWVADDGMTHNEWPDLPGPVVS